MEKKEAQDLAKTINGLASVIREQNKLHDKQNQLIRDAIDAVKELKTRLASVANAISNGSVVNSD